MKKNLSWRERLALQAQRIDALGLRERLFLFLAVAAVIGATLDALLITPLNLERRAQQSDQRKQSAELQTLRQQFSLAAEQARGDSPSAQLQRMIQAVLAEQAQLNQQTAKLADAARPQSAQPAQSAQSASLSPLGGLLAELLRQHAGLTLVKLNSLAELPKQAAGLTVEGWIWQGVEMRVAGDYLVLLPYLQELEQRLPGLRWGEMRVTAQGAGSPSLLQLQLFLLSAKP